MNLDETIYDILDCRKEVPKKKIRYVHRLDANYNDNGINVVKKAWATMGRAEYTPPNPSNYLRKNANSNLKRKPVNDMQCLKQIKMPPLPHDRPKISHKNINYIKQNILSIKTVKPRECEQKLVITRYGDTINGRKLEPTHIYSKKFGTVPEYIYDNVRCIEQEAQRNLDAQEIQTKLPSCRYVTRRERDQLLNGLKHNWYELSKHFQLLPVITDTVGKKLNKIEAETALDKIEKDIVLIEKCPYIYVQN